ncbi:hypothetical protein NLI96_g9588 [Meripilus lineatus]|uniref:DUF6593 domain-containing protein n=1 Tax=Meripilus lineatus TaxID=2056292 RepID=A0AAD5YF50_9APHY|nr:hypothetical protein NLI96_g9588 [Physisporinus lineatus]
MKLFLSRNVPFNTVLSDDEGHARYAISSLGKYIPGATTISRVSSETEDEEGDNESLSGKGLLDKPTFRDDGGFATLHWKILNSTTLDYNCQVYEISSFLPRTNFLNNKRTFQGPDGVTYTWSIGGPTSCLHVQDENGVKRRVVRMQQRNIFTGKKPHLDIDPSVLHILDLIIITWVYMETKRRERN